MFLSALFLDELMFSLNSFCSSDNSMTSLCHFSVEAFLFLLLYGQKLSRAESFARKKIAKLRA